MRITARYSAFGLYETAILGIFSQSTGWATAARRIVDAAAPIPVIGFGARHVHPSIADQMDYASVVGGCIGASTPAGARLAGLAPTGTMPHALVLIFGDTVRAAEAFDRHIEPDVPRIVLVDTFKDEAEEALRVAEALGKRLYGVRLDTPSERGRVTADLVKEVRVRLDQAGHEPREDRRLAAASTSTGSSTSRRRARRSTASRWAAPSPMPARSTSPATSRRSTGGRSPSAAASRGARTTHACAGSTSAADAGGGSVEAGPMDGADERDSAYELFQRGTRLLEEDHPGAAGGAARARAGARAGKGLDPRGARPRVLQPGPAGARRGTIPSHRGAPTRSPTTRISGSASPRGGWAIG